MKNNVSFMFLRSTVFKRKENKNGTKNAEPSPIQKKGEKSAQKQSDSPFPLTSILIATSFVLGIHDMHDQTFPPKNRELKGVLYPYNDQYKLRNKLKRK